MGIAHVAHAELRVTDLEASRDFFTRILGLFVSQEDDDHVYLRAWQDWDHHTLVLTRAETSGLEHVAWRVDGPEALGEFERQLKGLGLETGWIEGGSGVNHHGDALRFFSPAGVPTELFWEVERYVEHDPAMRSKLPSHPQRYTGHGVHPRRFDHVNFLVDEPQSEQEFWSDQLGVRHNYFITGDLGQGEQRLASWLAKTNLSHEIAFMRNKEQSGSLLHHVETPGLEINYLFRNVHDDVVRETKTQEPAVYGTLSSEEIYLKGDAVAAAANAEAEAERVAWTFVRATSEIATLRRFAQQFPASEHIAEVGDRIAQLESAEKHAWTIVQKQNSAAAYRAFLELYPYSDQTETARVTLASLETQTGRKKSDGGVELPGPPPSTYQLAAASPEATTKDRDSVEKVWDLLRDSRDKNVVGNFAQKYPSQRNNRIPGDSDVGLRRVNSTELMLRTAQDNDVNLCFSGDAASCVAATGKYPDLIQVRFQLCRLKGHPKGCMQEAVDDARKRGLLVSAYTKSEKEKARNREYRKTVARVQQNVSNVVSNVVSTTVGNVVNQAVSNAVSQAASNAASAAAANAASRAAAAAASNAASRAASSRPACRACPATRCSRRWSTCATTRTGCGA